MLTCISRISKLKKHLKNEDNCYFVFFAFLVSSNSIFPLRKMRCNISPSKKKFQLFHLFHLRLSSQMPSSLIFFFGNGILFNYGSFRNPNLFPLVKIGASTLHFLPHLPIYIHFVHLERLKMHS